MNRLFSQRQRNILAWVSGGKCMRCGKSLNNGFHADHVLAFTQGGKTVTANGQALCPNCNFKKGIQ